MSFSDFDAEALLRKYIVDNPELLRIVEVHSRAVADLALRIADERGLDVDRTFVRSAAMLHDIGVVRCDAPSISCFGQLPYICHGIEGAAILRAEGLERHARVCERHTGAGITADEVTAGNLPLPVRDYLPVSLEEKLICYADKFYSKSRDLTTPKPLAKIVQQMAAHGRDVETRFAAMVQQFGDPWAGQIQTNY